MDDKALVSELVASFTRQLQWYDELNTLVRNALSRTILSRGDMSQLMGSFARKQELVGKVVQERQKMHEHIKRWQERKSEIPAGDDVRALDGLLEKTETVIKEYLQCEQQMKKYLEHLTAKNTGEK